MKVTYHHGADKGTTSLYNGPGFLSGRRDGEAG